MRAVAASLCLFLTAAAVQADSAPRQYYSNWQYNQKTKVYHRNYYYKPTPRYVGYKHHVVVYAPQTSTKHLYYYNPYKKQYWGRCPTETYGKPAYSKLAEPDRKSSLAAIPPSAFPAAGEMPAIPESDDGATLDLPPDDLPGVAPAAE